MKKNELGRRVSRDRISRGHGYELFEGQHLENQLYSEVFTQTYSCFGPIYGYLLYNIRL